jgi:hypothetical protein
MRSRCGFASAAHAASRAAPVNSSRSMKTILVACQKSLTHVSRARIPAPRR